MPGLIVALVTLLPHATVAQQREVPTGAPAAVLHVRVESESRPVAGAQVRSLDIEAVTDANGEAMLTLPAGPRDLVVRRVGFVSDTLRIVLQPGRETTVRVELHELSVGLESVIVSATRGTRRVEDEPTRVEVLDHDEVQEKTTMSPGSVAHLLGETGGVKIAQTSPAFGAANIRVQGLRGRYTQLLSDGLPLFGLTTDGLGLLQIPPMDLDHVELIKGAASALYGPTAVGGVVNLVSRRPAEGPPTHQILLNQTSRDATDAVYYAARNLSARWGATLLASAHRQRRLDIGGDGWTDLPGFQRVVVRPRAFWNGPGGGSLFLTSGFTTEDRQGGGIVPGGGATPGDRPFSQGRVTRRGDFGGVGQFLLGGPWWVTFRASGTREWRRQLFGEAREHGLRTTAFSEVALRANAGAHDVVVGGAFERDALALRESPALGYAFSSPGVFAQDTWTPHEKLGVTASARLDQHSRYGTFVSPRLSALFRPVRQWNARISAGAGKYGPTPFVEETEEIGLLRLRPFLRGGARRLAAEQARSASADVGGVVGPVEVVGSVYASRIARPVGTQAVPGAMDSVELVNLAGPTRTRGAEFVAVYRRDAYRLTGTYAFLDATEQSPETGLRRDVPLTPRHSAGFMASWEPKEGSGIGFEAFYTGRQSLADDPYARVSRPYVTFGPLIRWTSGRTLVFVNSENLGGVRQTAYAPLRRPSAGLGGRWTVDAWAPLEGRVINAGVQVRLGREVHGGEGEEARRRITPNDRPRDATVRRVACGSLPCAGRS